MPAKCLRSTSKGLRYNRLKDTWKAPACSVHTESQCMLRTVPSLGCEIPCAGELAVLGDFPKMTLDDSDGRHSFSVCIVGNVVAGYLQSCFYLRNATQPQNSLLGYEGKWGPREAPHLQLHKLTSPDSRSETMIQPAPSRCSWRSAQHVPDAWYPMQLRDIPTSPR